MRTSGTNGAPKNRVQLYVVIALALAVIFLFFIRGVGAQSVSELEDTIRQLQATVTTLQAQLNSLVGGNGQTDITGTASANGYTFTRDLTIGSRGADVRALQVRLNEDPRTRVASTGPGSPGNETDYFGPLTANAVARYQELYRADILVPAGLSSGSGYFGPLTRAHFNAAVSTEASPADAEAVVPDSVDSILGTIATEFQDFDELILSFPSRYDGPRGATVQLSGFGFTRENNTVHLGDTVTIPNVPSLSGTAVTFTVPSNAPYGKHTLWVSNAKGESDKNLFFVVLRPGAEKPTIASTTPTEGFYGAEVTVYGSGFTETGNEIFTSYGTIKDVPSPDGTTLTFRVLPFPEVSQLEVGKDLGRGIEWPIWFYVINNNGVGADVGKFTLKI